MNAGNRRFSNDRKSRECKVPGRTYRESVRILRFCCVSRRYGRVYGEIVAEFLNGARFVGEKRGGGESRLVEILRIESELSNVYLRFFFFLNMITRFENIRLNNGD